MSYLLRWLLAVLGGAVPGAFVGGFFLTGFVFGGDWQAGALYGAVIGASIGGIGGAVTLAWEYRHQQELVAWAAGRGFTYHERIKADELRELVCLPRHADCSGRHHLTRPVADLTLHLVDVTIRQRSSGEGGDSYSRRTLLILPGAAADLPEFTLQPGVRLLGVNVLQTMGLNGISFAEPEGGAPAVRTFGERYAVHPFGDPAAAGDHDPERVEAVRRVFTRDVLELLAERPDWNVQARHGHLVLWRGSRFLAAAERDDFVRQGMGLAESLTERKGDALPASYAAPTAPDSRVVLNRFLPLVVGLMGGFFLGGCLGVPAFLAILFGLGEAFVPLGLVFFLGCPFGGAALGAYLAARWLQRKAGRANDVNSAAGTPP